MDMWIWSWFFVCFSWYITHNLPCHNTLCLSWLFLHINPIFHLTSELQIGSSIESAGLETASLRRLSGEQICSWRSAVLMWLAVRRPVPGCLAHRKAARFPRLGRLVKQSMESTLGCLQELTLVIHGVLMCGLSIWYLCVCSGAAPWGRTSWNVRVIPAWAVQSQVGREQRPSSVHRMRQDPEWGPSRLPNHEQEEMGQRQDCRQGCLQHGCREGRLVKSVN